jgi:coenzyme F420 biosynthesis associated uncharacterized protein
MSRASGPRRDAAGSASGGRSNERRPNGAFLQAGLLLGAAFGAAITVLGRRLESSARQGLIDWPKAERIGIERARRAPGALPPEEVQAAAPRYEAAMARIVPALGAALETDLPGVVARSGVVDRAGWVSANAAVFAGLIGRVEGDLLERAVPPDSGVVKATFAIANRAIGTRQLGFLLGFLGARVLGQYDLALLSAEAEPGRLLFVEENVRLTAAALNVPLDPFRTWIALHETTHAFEFEAHPWLRPYLASRIERQLSSMTTDASRLNREVVRRVGRALRGEASGEHWMEGIMTTEQRQGFREIQAIMSLLEGFGDYVMDRVGRDLVPNVEVISARFHARREQRGTVDRAVMRLLGMDLKMEQYRKGEAFVAAIAEARGSDALRVVWRGPETLPRPDEIDEPARWLARVMGAGPGSAS